jgi:hypothetical protein
MSLATPLFASEQSVAPNARPVRILCVGDSITQGGRADRPEYTYRYPLQQKLHAAGISFDFIGSHHAGLQDKATWPDIAPGVPFDPDHEGYYGNKTADVIRKVEAAWTDTSPAPDIVLIHLGTNDQEDPDHAAAVEVPLRQFIGFLRTKSPRVVILLGHLNFNNSEGASAIRLLVQALADELNTATSPVATVAHYQGWNEKPEEPDSDTFDWAHPNPQGQEKMASRWFIAMQPSLTKISP